MGLNFQDRDQFLSGVVVRFGAPIDARDWAEAHATNEMKELLKKYELAQGQGQRE